MSYTEDRWEPRFAAERLAERHISVLDYVGRVDQAVSTADLYYLADKGRELIRAVESLVALADELVEERTGVAAYVPTIEAKLARWGRDYRVARALHPEPVQA